MSTQPPAHRVDRTTMATAVARAVDGVAGARRSPGTGPSVVGTLHRGGSITGVALVEDRVEVHVVVSDVPIPPVAERVRVAAEQALRRLGQSRAVTVAVDDVDPDGLWDQPNGGS